MMVVTTLFLCGCQNQDIPLEIKRIETATPTLLPTTPTATQQPEELSLWGTSAHAHTNQTDASSNTYCARCHSPLNWNPGADSIHASSVSAGQWRNIGCEICHETSAGTTSPVISWWNPDTNQYQAVSSSTELCIQCHRDTGEFHYQINLGNSIHSEFECTDCHDPHSAEASCSNSGCHENIRPKSSIPPSTPTGGQHPNNTSFCGGANCHPVATQAALSNYSIHGATHVSVSCVACHDASGFEVGPSKELGYWITFQTTEVNRDKTQIPYQSHDIQTKVDCNRCHFEGNTWGLTTVTGNEFRP